MSHVFFCIYYINIAKNHTLISANFSLVGFVQITKKILCNSSFLCLSFGNSIESTSEFVELWNYGIFRLYYYLSCIELDFLTIYLLGRFQYVEYSGVSSQKLPISTGVPQRVCLGAPILIIITIMRYLFAHIETWFQ